MADGHQCVSSVPVCAAADRVRAAQRPLLEQKHLPSQVPSISANTEPLPGAKLEPVNTASDPGSHPRSSLNKMGINDRRSDHSTVCCLNEYTLRENLEASNRGRRCLHRIRNCVIQNVTLSPDSQRRRRSRNVVERVGRTERRRAGRLNWKCVWLPPIACWDMPPPSRPR